MTATRRLGTALTAIGLVSCMTACATSGAPGPRNASIFGAKVDKGNIGLATRAQAALAANDLATALELGERAVENSPRDAGFRALLGNIYLASGRFVSAEAAYRDSLSLVGSQPAVVLKLALVQIGLGKNEEAINLLYSAQDQLDVSDTGLALALAGRPAQAIELLDPAARSLGADSRLRQNLALAHAFAGNWDQARTIAAQDVSADQLDQRIAEWMTIASPGRAGSRIASFIGVAPVARDSGQPVRLALDLSREQLRTAAINPLPQVKSPPIATPPIAYEPAPPVVESVALAALAPSLAPEPEPAPMSVASPSATAPIAVADRAPAAVRHLPTAARPVVRTASARPALTPALVRLSPRLALRQAAAPLGGRSRAVVQLGAFGSRGMVAGAWARASGKYAALRSFTPVTARFESAKGPVYRLGIKGFASDRQAIDTCASLKRAGAACFVRAASGDAPVQFASR